MVFPLRSEAALIKRPVRSSRWPPKLTKRLADFSQVDMLGHGVQIRQLWSGRELGRTIFGGPNRLGQPSSINWLGASLFHIHIGRAQYHFLDTLVEIDLDETLGEVFPLGPETHHPTAHLPRRESENVYRCRAKRQHLDGLNLLCLRARTKFWF